jgi:uncharacterized protein
MDYKNKELCRLRTISFFLTLHKDKTQWESALYSPRGVIFAIRCTA